MHKYISLFFRSRLLRRIFYILLMKLKVLNGEWEHRVKVIIVKRI